MNKMNKICNIVVFRRDHKITKNDYPFVRSSVRPFVRSSVRPSVSPPLRLSVRMEEFGSLWTDFPET